MLEVQNYFLSSGWPLLTSLTLSQVLGLSRHFPPMASVVVWNLDRDFHQVEIGFFVVEPFSWWLSRKKPVKLSLRILQTQFDYSRGKNLPRPSLRMHKFSTCLMLPFHKLLKRFLLKMLHVRYWLNSTSKAALIFTWRCHQIKVSHFLWHWRRYTKFFPDKFSSIGGTLNGRDTRKAKGKLLLH